jgi:thiamine-phosphate pyrophosphorylase
MLRGYYAILDVREPLLSGLPTEVELAPLVTRADRLLHAGACMLQLRAKSWGPGALAALARAVHPFARAAGVPLCVNDRLDVALAVGAEAVHLGQDDLPLADARAVAGARLTIGISTHTPAQAQQAVAGGADYIGFGPVFFTGSKMNPDPLVGLDGLRAVAQALAGAPRPVPIVAIGGITPGRAAEIAGTGASAAALIGAMETAADPVATGLAVNAAFRRVD